MASLIINFPHTPCVKITYSILDHHSSLTSHHFYDIEWIDRLVSFDKTHGGLHQNEDPRSADASRAVDYNWCRAFLSQLSDPFGES